MILCYDTFPRFCHLTTLNGAPYNLNSWGGQTCSSKLTIQKRWANQCRKETSLKNYLNSIASPVWLLEQSTEPTPHSQQFGVSKQHVLKDLFSLWHKTPILGGIGRGGSKPKTSRSRIPVALFRFGSHPPLQSPAAAPGRLQGACRSDDAETRKVPKRNGDSFFFYFLSSLK